MIGWWSKRRRVLELEQAVDRLAEQARLDGEQLASAEREMARMEQERDAAIVRAAKAERELSKARSLLLSLDQCTGASAPQVQRLFNVLGHVAEFIRPGRPS